ncbi:MAG: alpha/beta fold hydrolase [Pseudomonadota bacterium]
MAAIARIVVGILALAIVLTAVWQLDASRAGLNIETVRLGNTPVRIYQKSGTAGQPTVVIAHGFAGSQQLMQPIALTIARNGYTAVTFDFLGHGRNAEPLTGDITREVGATQALLAQLEEVIAFARGLPSASGDIVLLAHSMGSDIIVRAANNDPDIAAAIAVSMFSREVRDDSPRNLLVIVGGWEGGLKEEALRVVALAHSGDIEEAVTYGDFDSGTARRAVFADQVEHVGVLYSVETMAEIRDWLNTIFSQDRDGILVIWGPWLGLLFLGAVVLAWPLSRLLPRVVEKKTSTSLGWRSFLLLAIVPAIVTPLILTVLPISFLPVLVGDYLAVHFGLYGVITAAGVMWARPQMIEATKLRWGRLVFATSIVTVFGLAAIVWPIDRYVTALAPIDSRLPLLGVMLVGMLLYFLADEWLNHNVATGRGRYLVTKICFLASLALAIALNVEQLFFLIIIFPIIVLFFIIFGLFSAWSYRVTGHQAVAAIANAVAFAVAIAGSFPMIEG